MMYYAKRMDKVRGSEIRSVGKKIAAKKDVEVIRFSAGLPDASLFPLKELTNVTNELFQNRYYEALQYGPTKGEVELLELLAERMREKEQIEVDPESILITTGSQQGIALTSMAFLDKGDVVVIEKPSYLDGLNACIPFECDFIGVDTDDDGMIISDLEKVLSENPKVKIVYVIPNFQNPTGKAWSVERRKQFMELINKYEDIVVIEDNPYGEIIFKDEFLPSLKSLDTQDRVIYLRSFSKVLCPGLRVAWACGREDIIEKMEILKEGMDLQSNQFAQIQVIEYLKKYDLDEHINVLKEEYKSKAEVMVDAMKLFFPEEVKYTIPEGGMFLWVELPEDIDAGKLLDKALDAGVAYIPGASFFTGGGGENAMRLNFTAVCEEQIIKGIKRLAGVFSEVLK